MRKFFAEVRNHILYLIVGLFSGVPIAIPIYYLVTFLESL